MNTNRAKGFGLLEIVVGISIISISIFSLAGVVNLALKVAEKNTKEIQAIFLAEEGIEALKVLRDTDWTDNIAALSPGTDYYLSFSNGNWQATSSNIYIDGTFERKFILENVYRDYNDDIAASGEIMDTGTKKLSVYVSWLSKNGTTTKSLSAYITNLFGN